jgi:membrane protein
MGAELTHGLSAARGEKARPEQQAEPSDAQEMRSG